MYEEKSIALRRSEHLATADYDRSFVSEQLAIFRSTHPPKTYVKPYSELTEEQKERRRANLRAYYYSHLEERRAYNRWYQKEHYDEMKEYQRKYREEHQDEILKHHRRYREEKK